MRYRGRNFSEEEIDVIRQIIKEAPTPKYRTPISRQVCRQLGWLKPDGGLKEMACRVALLQMEKDGLVCLPPPMTQLPFRKITYNHVVLPPLESIRSSIKDLFLEISLVTKKDSVVWNSYIDRYHYLGYTKLGGAQLRYIVRSRSTLIAFFGFSAAAWKVKPRDEFIRWTHLQREKNLHLIVNNSRFLILPSIEVPHLASHLLARMAKQLPADWHQAYGYRPVLIETFVQKDKFKGTCYKAANWIWLGDTQGRGKFDRFHTHSIPAKSVWVYPLTKNYAHYLLR